MYTAIIPLKEIILNHVNQIQGCSLLSMEEFVCDSEISKSELQSCIKNLESENFLQIESGILRITDVGKYKINNLSSYNTYVIMNNIC